MEPRDFRHPVSENQASLLDALPANLALLDAQGQILAVNKVWQDFGVENGLSSPAHGVGLNYLEICDSTSGPDRFDARMAAAGIRSVISGHSPEYTQEYPCHSPQRQRFFRLMVSPLPQGPGALVLHVNITARKVVEEQLVRSKEMYRLIFRNNPIPTWIYAEDSLNILAVNEAAVQTYGYTETEFLGMSIRDLRPEAEVERLDAHLRTALKGDKYSGIWVHRKKNGETFDVYIISCQTSFLDQRARLVLAQDVSLRLRFEEERERGERLQSLVSLAEGLGADLKEALAPIVLAADSLRQSALPEQLYFLDVIERSARRSQQLMEHIFAFAHGGTGEVRQTEMKDLLLGLGQMIRETLPRNLMLSVSADENLWPVFAIGVRLHHALLKLCLISRNSQAGRILLSARNIQLDETFLAQQGGARPGPYVLLEIQNAAADASSNNAQALAFAADVAREHQGLFVVTDQGRRFQLFLPAIHAAGTSLPPAAWPVGHGELLLLIEDERAIREVASHSLEAYGYRVLQAAEATTGVALLADHLDAIALVVVDLSLPLLDGRATALVLRHLAPRLPILFTGDEMVPTLDRASLPELSALLPKPYRTQALLEAIRDLLEQPGAA